MFKGIDFVEFTKKEKGAIWKLHMRVSVMIQWLRIRFIECFVVL